MRRKKWPFCEYLRITTSQLKQPFPFFIFHVAFLLIDHKNLQQDHWSSICNVLMMITGVIETFAICRLYRFHWPWFSLQNERRDE